jgi:hypothetical protein
VKEELCEAMFMTDPPDDMKWGELEWPIPAATFLIPDTEQVRKEFSITRPIAITVGRLTKPPKGKEVTLDHLLGKVRMPDGSYARDMVAIFYWDDAEKRPMFHDVTAPPDWTLAQSLDPSTNTLSDPGMKFTGEDAKRIGACTRMAVNLLAFMTSSYEPLEKDSEQPLRKASTRRNREKDALFGIRWLGATFRLRRHPIGGHHASPRGHWRRGFYRQQPHGPGRKMRRVQWIAPVFVNSEDE